MEMDVILLISCKVSLATIEFWGFDTSCPEFHFNSI
jgi:hypothetical protein